MAAKAGRGSDQFMVRFPDGLRDRIRSAAETNSRSMNAEIVYRLEASFTFMEAHHIKPAAEGSPSEALQVMPTEHRLLHAIEALQTQLANLRAELHTSKNTENGMSDAETRQR